VRIFKYLKAEHARSLLTTGEMLVRPPKYFREQEAKDPARGDKYECHVPTRLRMDDTLNMSRATEQERRAFERLAPRMFPGCTFDGREPGLKLRILGVNIASAHAFSQSLLYCLTTDGSGALHGEFGTDTIVEVTNPSLFLRLVGDALWRRLKGTIRMDLIGVHYTDFPVTPNDPAFDFPAYGVKERRFQSQKEVRVVATGVPPEVEQLDGLKIRVRGLPHTLRLVSGPPSARPLIRQASVRSLVVGPNDPCPCGSGRKSKKCHDGRVPRGAATATTRACGGTCSASTLLTMTKAGKPLLVPIPAQGDAARTRAVAAKKLRDLHGTWNATVRSAMPGHGWRLRTADGSEFLYFIEEPSPRPPAAPSPAPPRRAAAKPR
jgi:hypothetical protein